MNILVFGAQGSGKSTHAKYIADKLEVPYIYTGDLFRDLENEDSERGRKIRDLMSKGILIPNEISIPAFNEYLQKFDVSKGLVLDGYPRNLDQAQALPVGIDLVIHVVLPEKTAVERLMERGRNDDNPSAIKKRLELFKKDTEPIYDHYREKRVKIIKLNNSASVEKVQERIDDLLENKR
ncbi:MAG: nucleoside monophosphate kinase [Candidatus Woykebacteria bacterium]